MNLCRNAEFRGAHACRVPVSAFRRNELFAASWLVHRRFLDRVRNESSRLRHAIASTRHACAPQKQQ